VLFGQPELDTNLSPSEYPPACASALTHSFRWSRSTLIEIREVTFALFRIARRRLPRTGICFAGGGEAHGPRLQAG